MAVVVPRETAPDRLLSIDQAHDFLEDGCQSGKALSHSSRHGYLAVAVKRLAERLTLEDVAFLYCEPWNSPSECCAFLFKGEDLERILRNLARMLSYAESSQEGLAIDLREGHYNDGIGDGVIEYLTSFRNVCASAVEAGDAVVYVQWNL